MLEKIFPCFRKSKADSVVEVERPEPQPPKAGFVYTPPAIEIIDVSVNIRGKYNTKSGQAKGLVVHYTAGRSLLGRANAISTLRHLAEGGLGCLVMDKDGIIYRAKNQELNQWASHAGTSSWQGKRSVSQYCFGMEIACAGLLDANRKSWFGEVYSEDSVRRITNSKDNHRVGVWHKYTEAQEQSLINFCLWQLKTNPDFNIDWIIGHDECAIPSGRKVDPGASFSMTMPEFRDKLKSLASMV